nr:hypothetical protein [Tanacetum cinerariifolium]
STRKKIVQAPKASLGKRLKATTKMAKSEKKKLPAKGLETLSKVALSEAEQMQIAIKRSKTQFHSSQASGPGAHEGTGVISGVLDVPTYGSDDEHISWKSSDDEDDDAQDDDNADDEDDDVKDDDNKQTESNNDGDNFVHPKLSTFDEEARKDKEDKEAEGSDFREKKLDEEKTNEEEEEVNELYNDVNINLEGRDTEMTDALLANVQATQVIEDTYVIMTYVTPEVQQQSSSVSSGFISNMLNPTPDVSIDFILNLNTESTSLVDVPVTTNDDIPPSSVTTLPPLPIPLIHPLQQTSVFTPTIALKKRAGKEPESTSEPKEKTSKSTGSSKEVSKSKTMSTDKSTQEDEKVHSVKDLEEPPLQEFETEDPRETFNKLMDTPLDFSAFMLNRLNVDTLTLKLLAGPTFKLMKGSCKSLVELEYFLEEVCKATTDQLDWNNPKGQQYPHDLRKPLPLIPNSRGHRVIPFDHFIKNDLAYLSGGVSSRTYATLVTKIKDVNYGYIKWIEDLVPNTMESAHDVYSRNKIIAIKKLMIVEWHNYKHLEWIIVRRDDDKLYTFKEGDYNRLRLQDIKDISILLVQCKLTNLNIKERLALGVSLSDLKRKTPYKAYSNPKGFIYQNQDKKNRLMRINELHKFSDGILKDVRSVLDDTLKKIQIKCLPQTIWIEVDRERAGAIIQAIDQNSGTQG